MSVRSRVKNVLTLVALIAAMVMVTGMTANASIVTTGLSIHYRADDVDGLGNAGNGSTTTLVNLANPGTHNGTIVSGTGIVQNVGQIGTPYEYGVVLTGSAATHIAANTYQVGGGTDKVTSATWEFWLRADSAVTSGRGALYGEFPTDGTNETRHYLRLDGIGTATRTASYDEFPPSYGVAASDPQLFNTGTFTQIVVTKSGDTMTFYRDGLQLGSTKTSSEAFSGTSSIVQTVFGYRNTGNDSFDGQFNIIRVYDAVLTPTEVLQNFEAEFVPEPSTLVLAALGMVGLVGTHRRRRR
ncbi:MAG: PEP-CTERM sorting domain-containing protein [Pirellulales bacterium]|nr:PEP-CTERM sorting domain-containing protein [Pirellulales bacterium]